MILRNEIATSSFFRLGKLKDNEGVSISIAIVPDNFRTTNVPQERKLGGNFSFSLSVKMWRSSSLTLRAAAV